MGSGLFEYKPGAGMAVVSPDSLNKANQHSAIRHGLAQGEPVYDRQGNPVGFTQGSVAQARLDSARYGKSPYADVWVYGPQDNPSLMYYPWAATGEIDNPRDPSVVLYNEKGEIVPRGGSPRKKDNGKYYAYEPWDKSAQVWVVPSPKLSSTATRQFVVSDKNRQEILQQLYKIQQAAEALNDPENYGSYGIVPMTDDNGNVVLDKSGNPVLVTRNDFGEDVAQPLGVTTYSGNNKYPSLHDAFAGVSGLYDLPMAWYERMFPRTGRNSVDKERGMRRSFGGKNADFVADAAQVLGPIAGSTLGEVGGAALGGAVLKSPAAATGMGVAGEVAGGLAGTAIGDWTADMLDAASESGYKQPERSVGEYVMNGLPLGSLLSLGGTAVKNTVKSVKSGKNAGQTAQPLVILNDDIAAMRKQGMDLKGKPNTYVGPGLDDIATAPHTINSQYGSQPLTILSEETSKSFDDAMRVAEDATSTGKGTTKMSGSGSSTKDVGSTMTESATGSGKTTGESLENIAQQSSDKVGMSGTKEETLVSATDGTFTNKGGLSRNESATEFTGGVGDPTTELANTTTVTTKTGGRGKTPRTEIVNESSRTGSLDQLARTETSNEAKTGLESLEKSGTTKTASGTERSGVSSETKSGSSNTTFANEGSSAKDAHSSESVMRTGEQADEFTKQASSAKSGNKHGTSNGLSFVTTGKVKAYPTPFGSGAWSSGAAQRWASSNGITRNPALAGEQEIFDEAFYLFNQNPVMQKALSNYEKTGVINGRELAELVSAAHVNPYVAQVLNHAGLNDLMAAAQYGVNMMPGSRSVMSKTLTTPIISGAPKVFVYEENRKSAPELVTEPNPTEQAMDAYSKAMMLHAGKGIIEKGATGLMGAIAAPKKLTIYKDK